MNVADRADMLAEMEAQLATGKAKFQALKSIVDESGSDASDHAKVTLAKAEDMLASGRQELDRLAAAPDERFEEIAAQTHDDWRELSCEIEGGWNQLTNKIQSYFS